MGYRSLESATKKGTRLDQLRKLADQLAKQIDLGEDLKQLAPLAKQYRETIKEIQEIEGVVIEDDEIGEILSAREADGKSGAVRKSRSGISNN